MFPLERANELLKNIKANYPKLKRLLKDLELYDAYEDAIYRYYHQSFKVYRIQYCTAEIAKLLKEIAPDNCKFCYQFQELIDKGAGNISFKLCHNKNWSKHTRPFLEAFFHAKYFLEMAVKYGKQLDIAPEIMPYGWAALLTLYQIY